MAGTVSCLGRDNFRHRPVPPVLLPPCGWQRALLDFLVMKIGSVDPDVIVGHNICGFDLDVLLHRIIANNVPNWVRHARAAGSALVPVQGRVTNRGRVTAGKGAVVSTHPLSANVAHVRGPDGVGLCVWRCSTLCVCRRAAGKDWQAKAVQQAEDHLQWQRAGHVRGALLPPPPPPALPLPRSLPPLCEPC
jgi:hypothetical protein